MTFKPNEYRVALIDSEDRKLSELTAESFTDAMEQGETLRTNKSCANFAIFRVLYCSDAPHRESYDIRRKY